MKTRPNDVSKGTILADRYAVLRPLGEGGMGAAYLVEDRRLRRRCVAKASTLHDTAHREQFEREAQMLAMLSHPNLPAVYDRFFDRGHPYLVMQYIEGTTLDRLKEDRSAPFEVDQVLRWANDLLDALIYLHSQEPPVIHRDIKPSNVCITPEGKAVLLDFGIARQLDETSTRTGALAHSRHYAPIEQYPAETVGSYGTLQQYLEELKAADIHTGPYSDVYSLGATLYFALTLLDPMDACLRQLGEKLRPIREFNPDVPDFLAEALDRALVVDPRQRCQTAADLRQLLQLSQMELEELRTEAPEISLPLPVGRRDGFKKLTPLYITLVTILVEVFIGVVITSYFRVDTLEGFLIVVGILLMSFAILLYLILSQEGPSND